MNLIERELAVSITCTLLRESRKNDDSRFLSSLRKPSKLTRSLEHDLSMYRKGKIPTC
jgi:hypothetical protein